jgi:hypothetical protein
MSAEAGSDEEAARTIRPIVAAMTPHIGTAGLQRQDAVVNALAASELRLWGEAAGAKVGEVTVHRNHPDTSPKQRLGRVFTLLAHASLSSPLPRAAIAQSIRI